MDFLLKFERSKLEEIKRILLADDMVSRGSLIFKDSIGLGFKEDVYYCYISATEEICKKAKELVGKITKFVEGKEKQEVIEKIKKEEETAAEGFGAIFG
ncbi:MAG: hypothetical protein J4428_04230 [Candidatus Aenigmarchaeota archaeon]|nr:hypothetical protein [Candidatus Aenigmarchaeota archaeon]